MASVAIGFGFVLVFLIAVAALVLAVLNWKGMGGSGSKKKSSSCCGAKTTSIAATGGVTGADAFVFLDVLQTGATDEDDTGFQTVLTSYICTSKCENRLAVTFSAVTDLVAEFIIPTGGAIAADLARIEARVLIDGVQAEPGTITFDQLLRAVTTSPTFPGLLDLIDTTEAHAFTFLKAGVCSGCHFIEVQVRAIASATFFNVGIAAAAAAVGPRTVLVLASKDASCSPSSSSSTACCPTTPCCPSTPSCSPKCGCPSSSSSQCC